MAKKTPCIYHEHSVSGGISEHSQLTGVGAMIYTSRLTLTQGKWLINPLYTEYAVSVNTLYLYCCNQRAWSAVGGAAAAVTHARGKMVIKN